MKLPRNAKIFRGQLDAAPFTGVLFLLLIFLTLNSRLVFSPGVTIALPQIQHSLPGTLNRTVVVAIDTAGQLFYESQAITNIESQLVPKLREVVERSKRSKEPVTLEILADQGGKLDATTRLLTLAGELEFKEALIVTRPPVAPIPLPKLSPPR
jgi:biopolymer transport protein ExbD